MRVLTLTTSLLTYALPLLAQQELAVSDRSGRAADSAWAHSAVRASSNSAGLLKPAYRMRLVSDWPQLSAGDLRCVNGGQEVLEGTLSQTGDASYAGQFHRRATIRFCGAHAGATEMCTLTLTAEGTVAALGTVAVTGGDRTSPEIEFRWSTPEGASEAMVEGDCSPEFNEKVKQLYLAASHSLEFTLPPAGEPRRTMSLDDYGWIVDVQ